MNYNKEKLFKINDFAKLCGINRKTLIFYDNIGLFSPIFKDSNGYRYYSYQQYDTISIILALKEVDMPLSEIKEFIDNRSPELLINTLYKQKKIIKNHIEKLASAAELIDNVIKTTKNSKDIDFNKIYLEIETEENLVLSKKIISDNQKDFLEITSELINYSYHKKIANSYGLGAILSKENIYNNNFSSIDYLFMKNNKKIKSSRILKKPFGLYLIGYHIGSYEKTHITYEKLLKFLKENKLKIIGNSYEYEVLNCLSYADSNDYVTKIAINVTFIG